MGSTSRFLWVMVRRGLLSFSRDPFWRQRQHRRNQKLSSWVHGGCVNVARVKKSRGGISVRGSGSCPLRTRFVCRVYIVRAHVVDYLDQFWTLVPPAQSEPKNGSLFALLLSTGPGFSCMAHFLAGVERIACVTFCVGSLCVWGNRCLSLTSLWYFRCLARMGWVQLWTTVVVHNGSLLKIVT